MDQFIGTNGFIDVPIDKLEAVGYVREYHPWEFSEISDGVFEYNRWNGFWDFDEYYRNLHDNNITVCPVLWSSPSWLRSGSNNKPVQGADNPAKPESYARMSRMMYQFAARYGSEAVNPDNLIVNTGQVKKTGLGYLQYYEDWNEQDRDWDGREAQFYPGEYAAMASANVDGHGGQLGLNMGIKQADPGAKFVMGGLTSLSTNYLDQMRSWFVENRPDHSWPVDVINMHHYAQGPSSGISPEDDQYKQKAMKVAEWRNLFAPDNEVWITEFGYDMNSVSPNKIPVFAGLSQEEIQARWLMRTFLILSSAGIDRAAQFMIRDNEPSETEERWKNCGLTSSHNTGYQPKTSWYYTYTLKNILKNLHFQKVIREAPDVWVYMYGNSSSDSIVYALWSPSSTGAVVNNYKLGLRIPAMSATLIVPSNGSIQGISSSLAIDRNSVTLEVSEKPVFVLTRNIPTAIIQKPAAFLRSYPNPCTDRLFITKEDNTELTYRLVNAVGTTQLSGNSSGSELSPVIISTSSLIPGIYLLECFINGNRTTERIIKLKDN
jgi:hypothetical protein